MNEHERSFNIKAVVARLKASQRRHDAESENRGEHEGRNWAARYAEAVELRRIAKAVQGEFDFSEGEAALELIKVVDPDSSGQDCLDFWGGICGERGVPDDFFVVGFANGAASLWAEVESEL